MLCDVSTLKCLWKFGIFNKLLSCVFSSTMFKCSKIQSHLFYYINKNNPGTVPFFPIFGPKMWKMKHVAIWFEISVKKKKKTPIMTLNVTAGAGIDITSHMCELKTCIWWHFTLLSLLQRMKDQILALGLRLNMSCGLSCMYLCFCVCVCVPESRLCCGPGGSGRRSSLWGWTEQTWRRSDSWCSPGFPRPKPGVKMQRSPLDWWCLHSINYLSKRSKGEFYVT